jgi:hypothetical protein
VGDLLPNVVQEIRDFDIGVAESAFQSVAIHLDVKRKDYDSAIGVLHLYMAAFAMNFNEAEAAERGEDLLG